MSPDLAHTPLHHLHLELGARMVPFAGYEMPVQYPSGILAEHLHTRQAAGLFDVSHMGQARIVGRDRVAALEALIPGDIQALAAGRIRYSQLTNEQGGIKDDLMVTNAGDHLFLVVNAACKTADIAHIKAGLAGMATIEVAADRALLALQGPLAATVLARLAPEVAVMDFMTWRAVDISGIACLVSRSGYTGEDGFEISLPDDRAEEFARRLLAEPEVLPIGLGARDSLRLEAGLCLFGADIDETTTPVEAALTWSISKRRRIEGGFPGAAVVQRQLAEGMTRKLVGFRSLDKAPARAHTAVIDAAGQSIGLITSGGFGPSVGAPVAMGYVTSAFARSGTPVRLLVRGTPRDAVVADLPFFPHRYRKS
ncbi:glycine cleavage system aminomethyltransferase GcvT [Telmatospirillum sp.]|uniref:glycine cleavage system aminomethyltransferase GcvT n=1 Tax=Telmatospirillum sp. TaxID=2079197 RepID=UPI00283FD069|nr:glycine cleavage system aminomethyltransferase GcvT [Telmatospirillum sp.]MDR3435947.1 glycine cleavage system aminomethyltransferase GcvT [Telmatospirillum sp.]